MGKIFKVKVDDLSYLDIDETDALGLDTALESAGKYHVLSNHKSFHAEIIQSDFNNKKYEVKVNNNYYNINIFNDLDMLIESMGFTTKSTNTVQYILAPMPGLILEINIRVGQEIKENDTLLILEAMKMENIITSPRHGIIKSITINKGDAVQKNQLLIEFE